MQAGEEADPWQARAGADGAHLSTALSTAEKPDAWQLVNPCAMGGMFADPLMRMHSGDDGIASDVDSFLNEFLTLAHANDTNGGVSAGVDFSCEDFAWLESPDAFLSPDCLGGHVSPLVAPGLGGGGGSVLANGVPLDRGVSAGTCGAYAQGCTGGHLSGLPESVAVEGAGVPGRGDKATPATHPTAPLAAPSGGPCNATKETLRQQKVARYLAKKKRRRWARAEPSYRGRQRVANSRPRYKGRFLPLESEFVPIAELQRRQREALEQMKT